MPDNPTPGNPPKSDLGQKVDDTSAIVKVLKEIISLFGLIKGKTPHMSWNQAASAAGPLSNTMCQILDANVSVAIVDAYRDRIPREFADRIYHSGWWDKGNNQEPNIVKQLNVISNLHDSIQLSFSGLFVWAFRNAPSDNLSDAYHAIKKVLGSSLYAYLEQNNLHNVVVKIDSSIAYTLSQTATITETSDSPPTVIPTVISNILDITKSFLYPNNTTTTSGTTTKAGFSTIAIILLVGAALGMVVFFFRKKK